jgi:hypothetical protein
VKRASLSRTWLKEEEEEEQPEPVARRSKGKERAKRERGPKIRDI